MPESPTLTDLYELLNETRDAVRRLEEKQSALEAQEPRREFYSVNEFAELVERKPFTVRTWCKGGWINAQKKDGGRGAHDEWMIPASEVQRFKDHGWLPRP